MYKCMYKTKAYVINNSKKRYYLHKKYGVVYQATVQNKTKFLRFVLYADIIHILNKSRLLRFTDKNNGDI